MSKLIVNTQVLKRRSMDPEVSERVKFGESDKVSHLLQILAS
jgi:hypothetical protein